jgi:elongation factor Ts
LMECKRALEATKGDFEGAIDFLRKQGMKTAEKKATREMNEGRVASFIAPKSRVGALVALTCETDFVARTADFEKSLNEFARHVADKSPANVEAMLAQPYEGSTVGETIKQMVGKIGENISIGKLARFENMKGRVGCYIHHDGRKAAIVSVTTEATDEVATAALKDLCMHIVFANPAGNSRAEIPADKVERERAIYLEEVQQQKKPAEMQEKIVTGKLEKFYADNVLSEQRWFKDDSKTVQKVLDETLGKGAKIEGFSRFQIGS